MSERAFRLTMGIILLVLIYLDYMPLFYVYIFVLFFEGITNWRVPILVNRVRYGQDYPPSQPEPIAEHSRFHFEAERAMRLLFAVVMVFSIFVIPRELWFINWIIGAFLTLAGLVNFCPVVVSFKALGFR
ncbi:MAG: DUF2892 domain-containing protein [Gammaproteobacteria bacterium]|jgi:hypothetical protein